MGEGRRESWEVESKEVVTEVRQKRKTRQKCKKVAGQGRGHSEASVGDGKQVRPHFQLLSAQRIAFRQ